MSGVWDEKLPVHIPGLYPPNIPDPNSPISKLMAQMQAAKLAQLTGGQPQGSPARPGSLSPGPPTPGMQGAAGPLGSPGMQLPKGPSAPVLSSRPQIPYVSQDPYLRDKKQGLVADSIAGVFNAVQQAKQDNEKKEFQRAENTWSMLLQAQDTLQKNPNDSAAKATIQEILMDKKRMKEVEESLQIFLPKEGGAQEEQTPATTGAQSAIRKYMEKAKQVAKAAVDPRTQAQRIPSGTQLPAPNAPGGYRFSFPQPSAIQTATSSMLGDPAKAQQIVETEAKIRMTPAEQAKATLAQKIAEFNKEKATETLKINRDKAADYHDLVRSMITRNNAAADLAVRRGETLAGGPNKIPENVQAGDLPSNPLEASLVKQVAEYKIAAKDLSGFIRQSGFNKNEVLAWAGIYSGGEFNEMNYGLRQKLLEKMKTGKGADTMTSLNTSLHHLDELQSAFNSLGNGDWALINYARQQGKRGWEKGNPALKAFNDAADAVAGELATTFKGTGGTDVEIRKWRDGLSAATTPDEMAASMQEYYRLVAGRLDAIQGTWERGAGDVSRPFSILDPQSIQVLNKYGLESLVEKEQQRMGPMIWKPSYGSPGSQPQPQGQPSVPMPQAPPPPTSEAAPRAMTGEEQFEEVKQPQ